MEGLEPLGVVNDLKDSYVFYFFFLKVFFFYIYKKTGLSNEEAGMDDMYKCLALKTTDAYETGSILSNWANTLGMRYKMSFPVYKKSFEDGIFLEIKKI